MKKKVTLFSAAVLVMLSLALQALPAHAGGWATVGITAKPGEIQAGTPFTIEFMVWQHGNKPVHELNWDNNRTYPVAPKLTFASPEAGEKLTFEAFPLQTQGLFRAEITLPAQGEYHWSIAPDPLAGVTEFDPLLVGPPAALSPASSPRIGAFALPASSVQFAAPAAALILLGLAYLAFRTRTKA